MIDLCPPVSPTTAARRSLSKVRNGFEGFSMEPFAASAGNRVSWECVLWRKLLGSRATQPLKAGLGLAETVRTAEAGADGKIDE